MKKSTRRIRKTALFAIIGIIVSLIITTVMSIYTISIEAKGVYYTTVIAQAYQDAQNCHPDGRQEYVDAVYERVNPQRQALYNENSYNQWFFNQITTGQRLLVILGWSLLPLSTATIITWIIIDEKREKTAHR